MVEAAHSPIPPLYPILHSASGYMCDVYHTLYHSTVCTVLYNIVYMYIVMIPQYTMCYAHVHEGCVLYCVCALNLF